MSATKPVLLIFGAGANIGQGVAKAFAAQGYSVATTSRSEKTPAPADGIDLHIKSDLVDSSSIPGVFEQVRRVLGQAPSVVVYNGESLPSNQWANSRMHILHGKGENHKQSRFKANNDTNARQLRHWLLPHQMTLWRCLSRTSIGTFKSTPPVYSRQPSML